jgi:hypothetical protein
MAEEGGDEDVNAEKGEVDSASQAIENDPPNLDTIPPHVLFRIARGDAKGRRFGTPRNPRTPTIEEFNPRILEVRADALQEMITLKQHPEFPSQRSSVAQLSNHDLIRYRSEDPISAARSGIGLCMTGGHHRTAEISRRVQSGRIAPETIIRVLAHD